MFELWMIYVLLAVAAILTEIFAPSFFCINFAFAGVITALLSLVWGGFYGTMTVFIIISLLSILFIRPVLVKYFKKKPEADFNEQYIGKIVKVIVPVTIDSGAVTIYDERWEARVKNGAETIDAGCSVKITGSEGLILFVEKV